MNTELGRLTDENNNVCFIAYVENSSRHYIDIRVDQICAWNEQGPILPGVIPDMGVKGAAVFSVIWDGRAHIGLRDPELNKEWLHVCGVDGMRLTLRMLAWAWNLAYEALKQNANVDMQPIQLEIK